MNRKASTVILAATLILRSAAGSAQQPVPELISRDSLQRIVSERVAAGRSTGLIVGAASASDERQVAATGFERPGTPIDRHTLFEIGSITKAFTGILLAEMVLRGEVRLDQPVAELLPPTVRMPSRSGKPITLGDLASQVSGLTRLPSNMRPADAANPYADYTVAQMYEFLGQHELRRDPGAQYEYSNLGVGLLGHALALRAGKPYEQLLRERVLTPLGMTSTGIVLTEGMKRRMSEGHDPSGRVVPLWDLPTLAGAGALRSSLDDMMKFASAVMSPPDNAIGRAIRLSVAPRFRVNEALSLGLNWHRVILGGDTIIFHNGGTAGFRTYLGVNPRRGVAVVLLGNSAQDNEDIARHVLVPSLPLIAIVHRKEIALPADVLAQYVGEYRLLPQLSLTVTLEGNALQAQPTGQPKFPLFAEARDRFFLKVVDAQIEFRRDSTGAVTGLTLFQNGNALPGSRTPE
jgi:CubicO group peptidase (beta-lactamase class C family)